MLSKHNCRESSLFVRSLFATVFFCFLLLLYLVLSFGLVVLCVYRRIIGSSLQQMESVDTDRESVSERVERGEKGGVLVPSVLYC